LPCRGLRDRQRLHFQITEGKMNCPEARGYALSKSQGVIEREVVEIEKKL
jgi:hypothetical protein